MSTILYPTLSCINADFLFRSDEDGMVNRAIEDKYPGATKTTREVLADVANEALGNERNEPKDYAWRFYDIDDAYTVTDLELALGLSLLDQALCAIATIGDREIVFTCDC